MVYAVGIVGFVCGFFLGQYMLMKMLKNRTTEELRTNKYLRLQYGIMNWVVAFLSAYCFVELYKFYFS